MRFPLKAKAIGGYRFKEDTFYHTNHLGTDWRAKFVNLYAPTDGVVESTPYGTQGGQWLHFRDDTGNLHRFAHLSEIKKTGKVKEGDKIAVTGNSGQYTTAPHLHEDITKAGKSLDLHDLRNFIDPEIYYNQKTMKKDVQKFYDSKKKTQGWETLSDWVEASMDYRDDRENLKGQLDKINKKIEIAENSLSSLKLTQDKLNKAHDIEIENIRKGFEKELEQCIEKANEPTADPEPIYIEKVVIKAPVTIEHHLKAIHKLLLDKWNKFKIDNKLK